MATTYATRRAQLAARTAPPSGPAISAGVVDLEALSASHGAVCHALAQTFLRDVDLTQDGVLQAFLEPWRTASFDEKSSTHAMGC